MASATVRGGDHATPSRKRTSGRANGKAGHAAAPVDRIERWSLDRLTPYANNPRLHTPEQVDQIAASMREFGQAQLVVVDEAGEIIAGHGRILAAQKLGWPQIVVAIAKGWTDAQKRAYRIADNQISLTSRWDDALLRTEVIALKGEDFDLSLLAFEPGMLQALSMDFGKGDNDLLAAWQGMPGFDQLDQTPFRTLLVHFKDQKAVNKFAASLGVQLTDRSRFIWYPEQEPRAVLKDKRWAAKTKAKKHGS